jgi:hypothetical protein
MIPTTIKVMEPPIRQRFHFAASAFSRLFGVEHVSSAMIDFCYRWAETNMPPPLDDLNKVDKYFKHLWDTSQQLY